MNVCMYGLAGGGWCPVEKSSLEANLRGTDARSHGNPSTHLSADASLLLQHPAAHPMQRGKDPLRTGRSAKLGKARRLTHQGCVRLMHWPGRPAWARTARVHGHEAW